MSLSTSLLISAVNDAETHQSNLRSIWKKRRCIIPVITCDEQMHSRCVLLLAQVLHSRSVQICLAMPDNSGAICLRLLASSVLQRTASKCPVNRPKGNDENRVE